MTAQFDYLHALNPTVAARVLTDIHRACRLVGDFPGLGRRIEGTSLRFHITRRYRYRVIYRHRKGLVEIREVLHPRQNMKPLD